MSITERSIQTQSSERGSKGISVTRTIVEGHHPELAGPGIQLEMVEDKTQIIKTSYNGLPVLGTRVFEDSGGKVRGEVFVAGSHPELGFDHDGWSGHETRIPYTAVKATTIFWVESKNIPPSR